MVHDEDVAFCILSALGKHNELTLLAGAVSIWGRRASVKGNLEKGAKAIPCLSQSNASNSNTVKMRCFNSASKPSGWEGFGCTNQRPPSGFSLHPPSPPHAWIIKWRVSLHLPLLAVFFGKPPCTLDKVDASFQYSESKPGRVSCLHFLR